VSATTEDHRASAPAGPLTGIRVLDLGQGVAGPYCGQLLADAGADVIKIEPPRGDWGRTLGNRHEESGLGSTFLAINRSKRSVSVDLSDVRAGAAVRRLAGTCDVFIESFRPGVLDRLGLGFEELRQDRPGLVYCSVNGFGTEGPMAASPASDSMMQAYGGLMSIIGDPDGAPMRVGTVVSDMIAGSYAFSAVLLALIKRGANGAGSHVEVNLLDSLMAFQSTGLMDYLITGQVPQRPGNRHPLIGASGVAHASDGWFAIGILDHYWEAFVELAGADELRDPRFATGPGRLSAQAELWKVLDDLFATRSVSQWVNLLRPAGIVCGPVQDYADLAADPQVAVNGTLARLPGGAPAILPPFRIDGHRPAPGYDPPQVGEHTREVLLQEAGLSPAEIDELCTG
jgi:crotonobetainyl-CoA:carnitine CoA-transferase CaiB-like acyl-CoA transferase